MIARRNRQVLSPVQQHQPMEKCESPLFLTAPQFKRSCPSFGLAGPGSSLFAGPASQDTRVSCFVQVPPAKMNGTKPVAPVGTKRKRIATQNAAGTTRTTNRAKRSTGGDASSASTGYRRGFLPATPRKPSSIASNNSDWSSLASVSPSASRNHSLYDAPDEMADDRIDGERSPDRSSSRASLRQSMRSMTLDDRSSPPGDTGHVQSRPPATHRLGSQEGSRHTMGRSRSAGQLKSPGKPRGNRAVADPIEEDNAATSASKASGESTEDERLLATAPTWQLSRLRKEELVRLNKLAGTWSEEETVDMDLYTKQELVNGIIVCRSRLDKSKSLFKGQTDQARRKARSSSFSSQRSKSSTGDVEPPIASTSRVLFRSSSRRSAARSLRRASENGDDGKREVSRRQRSASASDGSHEAGGEETEAEAVRTAGKKRVVRRPQTGTLRRMDSSIFDEAGLMLFHSDDPKSLDSSSVQPQYGDRSQESHSDDHGHDQQQQQQQQSHQASLPRRQLRTRSALAASRASRCGRDRSVFGGSDAANASSSSLAFTNSGFSPLKHPAMRRQGSRRNLFVASSPVRANSRASGGLPARRRPVTRATASTLQELFGEGSGSSRTPRAHRKSARSGRAVAFRDDADGGSTAAVPKGPSRRRRSDDMEEDWEEASSPGDGSDQRPAPQTRLTRAKARQNSLVELSADDADSELVSQLSVAEQDSDAEGKASDDAEDQDVEESHVAADKPRQHRDAHGWSSARGQRRVATRTRRGPSDSKQQHQQQRLDGEPDGASSSKHHEIEDPNGESSSSDPETPVKFRKLRNGKLRMPVAPLSERDALPVDKEEEGEDIDMDPAEGGARADVIDDDGDALEPQHGSGGGGFGSIDKSSPPLEDAIFEPTAGSLARLRRAQLVDLCASRDIETDETHRKADLIDRLLAWYSAYHSPPATIRGDDSMDTVESDSPSDSSASTAKAGTDADLPTPRKHHKKHSKAIHRSASPTESEVPLLLRARANKVESSKLPTPPLTTNNGDAHAPEPGDGVDELNGLDLEGLDLLDKEIPPNKLEKLDKIGSGGFKDVYVGKYRISKTRVNRVAIADIRDQLTEMDIKELSLLRDLRHENIVRFIGVSIPDDPRTSVPCMIVSELCVNGDLFDYIRNTAPPSDAEVFRILLETARGLEYLHTRTPAIIHRDCKSTNVLITRNRTAKINDFGLAKVKNTKRSMMRSLVGTVNWQAVELWVPKPHYNEKVDVWSAAMTFWETLQWHQAEKKYPFQGMNEHQIYLDVGQKKLRPYTGAIRRQFGGEIVDLLDRMWDHSPKERPSMTQVCEELEGLVRMKKAQASVKK